MSDLTAIPDCEPYVRGVMNLRGRIIPVIDVRKRLGGRRWKNKSEPSA